ncbi:MAG: hypothetical protein Q9225_006723 [Loekoesia sp. 1 TL-2023]
MSALPISSQSLPSTQPEGSPKKTKKPMAKRVKHICQDVIRGEIVWKTASKGSREASSVGSNPLPAPDAAHQRSILARENTAEREKQEAERAQRRAERVSQESQRRQRGSSDASSLAFNFRRFRPRRPSGLSNVQPQAQWPMTFDQAIRHGQQQGRGVESVAEEILSRNNSVANLSLMGKANETKPKSVKKAHSAHELAVLKPAEEVDTAPPAADKEEDIRATKSAVDLREGPEDRKDSGHGSMDMTLLEPVRRAELLQVEKRVSIVSSKYSQPEAATVEDEREEEGITMAAAAAAVA